MRFRPAFPIAVLCFASLLGGCGSSDSPTSGAKEPKTDTDPELKVNGALTVEGKTYPAHVSGLFDDTTVSLNVLANLNALDTGWTLAVSTRPAPGPQPVTATGLSLNATHLPTASDTGCVYSVTSGSANFDAWTPFLAGGYGMARMSGSLTVSLRRWFLVAEGCPEVALAVTFADAEATDVKVIDGILQ